MICLRRGRSAVAGSRAAAACAAIGGALLLTGGARAADPAGHDRPRERRLRRDWPQWLGPNRDGITQEGVSTWPPRELWRASVGLGYSSIVVARGRVFAMGHEKGAGGTDGRGVDTVCCFDSETGAVIWRHSYGCLTGRKDSTAAYLGPRATPATDGESVYTLSLEGHLLCLDAASGNVVWSRKLLDDLGGLIPFYGYCCSPLLCGDMVIVELNAPGASYAAFDRRTGEVVWRSGDESASTASPVLARVRGKTFALFISGKVLAAHDVSDGAQVWRVDLGWDTWMGPVPSGELVFASSASLARGCAVYKFGEDEPLWRAKRKYQALHCNTVIWDGHVYGSDNTRTDYQYQDGNRSRLKCIELATGEVRWTLKGLGWANVVMARDRLLILREDGELMLMDVSPSGCAELGRAKVIEGPCWTVPALAGGRIYCRSNKGDVVCLEAGEGGTASRAGVE